MKRSLLVVFLCVLFSASYSQTCSLSVSVASSNPAICSGSSVTLTATASSGTAPYTYAWNTGETTSSISVNKAGTYTVTVKDNTAGCQPVSQTITISASTTPSTPTALDGTTCPGGTATLQATAPGGLYQWYDAPVGGNLLATGDTFTTPPLNSTATYYVETTISQCTSPRKSVKVTISNSLRINNAFICEGNTATLSASGASSYQWYDAASGGNLVSTSATYTTPVLTSTKTYYVIGSGNGCTSNRTPVTANVTPTPQAPVAASVTICSGSSANLSATSSNGLVFDWFDVPNGGTSLITSPDYTTPPLTASTTYYVQSSSNGCVSPRTAVTVTVNAIPQTPVVTSPTICSGTSATLTASGSIGTYQWYNSSFSQTPLATGASFQTPVLTTTTTYYVLAANGSCNSSRTAVTVTVNPALAAPSASGQIVCSGSSANLTASAQSGTIEWYDAATGGNLLASTANYTTPPLTVNTTYYVQTVSNGCSSPRSAVQVQVLPVPLAPSATGQTICSGTTATLVASGSTGNYEWYNASSGGNLLASGPAFVTPVLAATTTYYVQGTSSSCSSTRTPVTVTVNPTPVAPTASGATVCQGTAATLTANSSSGTVEWYSALSAGALLASGNSFTTPNLIATTTYYIESVSGQCSSSRVAVTVNVTAAPDPQFQYPLGTFCTSSPNPTPVINDPSGGTFSASPAGLVFVSTTTGQINLAASAVGNYIVTFVSKGACAASSNEQVAIVSSPDAQFSYQGPYCQYGPNPLPVYVGQPNPGVFSATPAGLVFVNTSTGEIDLTQSKPGTYTITNNIPASGTCGSSTFSAGVTINQAPVVYAGPNQTVATGSKVQLAGSFSGSSSVTWTGGGGSFSNPSSVNAVYTPAAGETSVTLTLTTSDPPGPCGPQSSTVTISFQANTGAPQAAGTTICSGSTATLVATSPGGAYQWYDASSGGNLLGSGQVFNTPPLIVTTTYYVQTTIGSITSSRTAVTVTVNTTPAAPTVSQPTGICTGSSTTLTASGSAGTYQWYDAVTGGNLIATGSTYNTPALIATTNYYVQTTVNTCVSPRTQVTVTVNPVPTITSAPAGNTCSGTALNYTITSDIVATYSWSRAAVAGISNQPVSNQTSGTITETLINTGTVPVNVTYVIIPMANGCSGNSFNLVITVYPAVTVTSAAAETICNTTASNYAIVFSYPPTSFSWSRAAVAGISNSAVSNQTASTIREVLTNTTNAPIDVHYTFTINTSNCPVSPFDLVVTVTPSARITSAVAGTICSGVPQNYVITADVSPATFTWTRPFVANISNSTVTNQTSDTINETLNSTSSNPVLVTYKITPFYNNCPGQVFSYAVTVNPQSPTPIANSNSPVCLNSTIKLQTVAVPGATYLWTGPGGFSSTSQNPTIGNVTKANAGTYYLSVNSNGCNSAVDSVSVSVDDFPQADAGGNQSVCATATSVQLAGIISGGTTTGVWSTSGTGTFSPASNQLDAQYLPSAQDVTAGSVILTLSSTSKDDCNIATSTATITFQPAPTADAGGDQEVCSQVTSVALNGQATNNTSVLWTTAGAGSFSPSANVANASYIPGSADIQNGTVILTFHAQNNSCSETTSTATIKFDPPPTVNAGKVVYVIKGKPIMLTPQVSDNNVQYLWTPAVNIDDNTIKDPTIVALQDITYTLTVTDSRGCITVDQVLVKVLNTLSIPNTFTPNGDGINDKWDIPALNDYPDVTVDIFTRYGQKVFHSNGYGVPWDGNYNGTPLPVGVYYYVIDTKYQDQKIAGFITIIR